MRIVWFAHSGLRYLVLLSAVVLVLSCLVGLAAGKPGPRAMRVIGAVFLSGIDLQFLLGLALLAMGYASPAAARHAGFMLGAVVAAHAGHVLARKRPEGIYGWRLAGALLALGLITFGVHAIGRHLVGTLG